MIPAINNLKAQETVLLFIIPIAIVLLFWDMGLGLIDDWSNKEEYSHGFFLPLIAVYFFWQRLDKLVFSPNWIGVALALVSILIYVIGTFGYIVYLFRISFLLLLLGIFISCYGFKQLSAIIVPLILIFLSYPLPSLINTQLTAELQLVSSQLGVFFIRLFDISVYLEGNLIDLGSYKLQVVEACSGLRYLYPLVSLALIVVYLFKVPLWKKVVIFLSAIPITVFMNSFRIGAIGVLMEYFGQGMAEGFLHDFEGWIIFMACFLILFIEMWLLTYPERRKTPFINLINRI